jgi:regulator of protease activity HflC (stomatin/prohibitin superfamily)
MEVSIKEKIMDIALLVRLIAAISWFIAFSLIVVNATRGSQAQSTRGVGIATVGMVALSIVLTVAGVGIVFVRPSFRGVVTSAFEPGGYRTKSLGPGLHWIFPFAETVSLYNISRRTYTMSSKQGEGAQKGDDSVPALTKDRQIAKIDASVIYALDPDQVVNVNILWQSRFEDSVVRPVSRSVILDAVSQYSAEELISGKRFELEKTITDTIQKKFASQSLILSEFVLRDITFSPEYAAAIEQKQIAEQQALQAKLLVEQKRQEAEQARQVAGGLADARLIEAQAEAKALALVAQLIKENPDVLTYQYISKLAPNVQVMLVPSNAPYILPQLSAPPITPTLTPPGNAK